MDKIFLKNILTLKSTFRYFNIKITCFLKWHLFVFLMNEYFLLQLLIKAVKLNLIKHAQCVFKNVWLVVTFSAILQVTHYQIVLFFLICILCIILPKFLNLFMLRHIRVFLWTDDNIFSPCIVSFYYQLLICLIVHKAFQMSFTKSLLYLYLPFDKLEEFSKVTLAYKLLHLYQFIICIIVLILHKCFDLHVLAVRSTLR